MKKHIWIVCQYATSGKHGLGSRHYRFAEEFTKSGHTVTVITSTAHHFVFHPPKVKWLFTTTFDDGVRTFWVKTFSYRNHHGLTRIFNWFWFAFLLPFVGFILREKPDVVIVSSPAPVAFLGATVYKFFARAKLIFEVRDIWPQTFIDVANISPKHPLVRLLGVIERIAYRYADHIVATMPRADLHIRKFVTSFSFQCIPQGIDQRLLSTSSITPDEFKGIFKPNTFNVGYAGAVGASNALLTFIKAAKALSRVYPQMHFYILGDGPEKPALMELAAETPQIHFVNKVKRELVSAFLAHCDVVYDSTKAVSIYQYGISRNKWIDYMLSGRPLLVSYSGYVSLINEADCGVVVPAEDEEGLKKALMSLVEMPVDERRAMGERGRAFVLKYRTFETLSRQYEQLF